MTRLRRCGLALLSLALASAAGAANGPVVAPVTLSELAWTKIPLPDMALGITAQAGAFWVCGANEMIAVSRDGGRTWTVKHRAGDGEMLFSLDFVNPQLALAFGSGGVRLRSKDGGETWSSMSGTGTSIVQATLDAQGRGWATDGQSLLATSNGGNDWRQGNGPPIDVLASSGAAHVAAVQSDQPKILISTADGGKTWRQSALGQLLYATLTTHNSQYWLFGAERVAAHNYRPLAFISPDGATWLPVPAPPVFFRRCESQGCVLASGWVDLSGDAPVYWDLPALAAQREPRAWAAAGTAFCGVRGALECALARLAPHPPAPLEATSPPPEYVDPDSALPEIAMPKPLSTPDPPFPKNLRAAQVNGAVMVQGVITVDGHFSQPLVLSTTRAEFALQALQTLQQWRFQPAQQSGVAVPATIAVAVDFKIMGDR